MDTNLSQSLNETAFYNNGTKGKEFFPWCQTKLYNSYVIPAFATILDAV